jgi:hypothetical protein
MIKSQQIAMKLSKIYGNLTYIICYISMFLGTIKDGINMGFYHKMILKKISCVKTHDKVMLHLICNIFYSNGDPIC